MRWEPLRVSDAAGCADLITEAAQLDGFDRAGLGVDAASPTGGLGF